MPDLKSKQAFFYQQDYGWVWLEFTQGTNGLANAITAEDWAYENSGSPIHAGDTGLSAAPEPSTAAMALLSGGAAGIVALRRRRISAA